MDKLHEVDAIGSTITYLAVRVGNQICSVVLGAFGLTDHNARDRSVVPQRERQTVITTSAGYSPWQFALEDSFQLLKGRHVRPEKKCWHLPFGCFMGLEVLGNDTGPNLAKVPLQRCQIEHSGKHIKGEGEFLPEWVERILPEGRAKVVPRIFMSLPNVGDEFVEYDVA